MDLDAPCGEHFRYRDLVECGETWRRLTGDAEEGRPFDNMPQVAQTFRAMEALCAAVLDPVVRHFGQVELTYAFASRSSTRHIAGRIHPPVDQHAGHELDPSGSPICRRLGLAADFLVPGVDSRNLARWIATRTAFDRLYFYEADRPIHVSVGPDELRQIVYMRREPSGRRVPRVVPPGFFDHGS